MHELSIAYRIVETCNQAADEAEITEVVAVQLQLGVLSGVVTSALLFSWDIATEGTRLAGARLEIETVPLVVRCPQCEKNVTLPTTNQFRCPICATPTPDIIQGKELDIVSLKVPEDEPA